MFAIKVPESLHREVVGAAESAGLTITDYAAGLIAAAHQSGRGRITTEPRVWSGPREVLSVRVPVALGEAVVAAAAAADMTIMDYGASLLAMAHGRDPVIAEDRNVQEELLLGA